MRENTESREDVVNGTSPNEEKSCGSEYAPLASMQESDIELLFQNQSVAVNQSGIDSSQLVYQIQRVHGEDQSTVYFLVPANENIQLPLSILPDNPPLESAIYYFNKSPEEQPCSNLPKEAINVVETIQQEDQQCKQTTSDESTKSTEQTTDIKIKDLKQWVYHCGFPECFEVFDSLYEKKQHQDSHKFPENNNFKCSICNMKFSKAADRNKHVESHTVPPTYKCKICQQDFSYFTALAKHLVEKNCSERSPLTCCFCKYKFTNTSNLVRHHQTEMKQCSCGVKECGPHLFASHICNETQPKKLFTFQSKRMKIDTEGKKIH